MAIYAIKLERVVTTREVAEVTIEADDFSDADNQARDLAKTGELDQPDWRVARRDAGKAVVTDVEQQNPNVERLGIGVARVARPRFRARELQRPPHYF
ncbi:hypothetical protein G3545_26255 [Starkeya sp. ORNL1]|uniref:hypothetical protein n=1 Tax=Starkeya sp. ORNL1 TaxID=2709380 RepID=UPI001462996F|nr:hypothetical protein [Starkeya sp. ORNL1]QJP16832.1 hypothetical protein G3545_26255 [Starkeya sp. ORNL1]